MYLFVEYVRNSNIMFERLQKKKMFHFVPSSLFDFQLQFREYSFGENLNRRVPPDDGSSARESFTGHPHRKLRTVQAEHKRNYDFVSVAKLWKRPKRREESTNNDEVAIGLRWHSRRKLRAFKWFIHARREQPRRLFAREKTELTLVVMLSVCSSRGTTLDYQ